MSDFVAIRENLAPLAVGKNGVQMANLGNYFYMAELMQKASMLPKGVTVEGAVISMVHGSRIGLDCFASVQSIASINGRPCLWGDAQQGVVMQSGLLEDISKEVLLTSDKKLKGFRVTVHRKGIASPFTGVFTYDMAKTAGLLGKAGPWASMPERMLFVRARAFALRDAFPDVLQGIYCREEEQDRRTQELSQDEVSVSAPPYAEEAKPPKADKLKAAAAKKVSQLAAPAREPEAIDEADIEPAKEEEPVKATAILCHEDGHAEVREVSVPPKAEDKLGHGGLSFGAVKMRH